VVGDQEDFSGEGVENGKNTLFRVRKEGEQKNLIESKDKQ